jgi:tRNA(Ile)-lysidine synthetase-like protein
VSGLRDDVVAFVAANDLWQSGATLLVAVSGGPDSLCLLSLLKELSSIQELALHVAHLDHALRPDSAADAHFVVEVAQSWEIPVTVARCDVQELAGRYGGVEAAARAVRYGFLRDTALAVGATAVATGHNADDQAETVVQRLLRGAGPGGLAAMRPRLSYEQWAGIGVPAALDGRKYAARPNLVRPLLASPRSLIEAYCVEHGLNPRHDRTNQSPEYLRNRVRDHIIPLLKTYNSNIVGTLGRTARIAADEDALLRELLDQEWQTLVTVSPDRVQVHRSVYMDLHRALQRRALRRAASIIAPGVELGADHLDRMMDLARRSHGRLQLPGGLWMHVTRQGMALERLVDGSCTRI